MPPRPGRRSSFDSLRRALVALLPEPPLLLPFLFPPRDLPKELPPDQQTYLILEVGLPVFIRDRRDNLSSHFEDLVLEQIPAERSVGVFRVEDGKARKGHFLHHELHERVDLLPDRQPVLEDVSTPRRATSSLWVSVIIGMPSCCASSAQARATVARRGPTMPATLGSSARSLTRSTATSGSPCVSRTSKRMEDPFPSRAPEGPRPEQHGIRVSLTEPSVLARQGEQTSDRTNPGSALLPPSCREERVCGG